MINLELDAKSLVYTETVFVPRVGMTDMGYLDVAHEQSRQAFDKSLLAFTHIRSNVHSKIIHSPRDFNGYVIIELTFRLTSKYPSRD